MLTVIVIKKESKSLYHLVCFNILEEDVKQCCNTNPDDDSFHDVISLDLHNFHQAYTLL